MQGFTMSSTPPRGSYIAKMTTLGVFAQVVVVNPQTQSLSGRLRVYFTDPQGNEKERFTGWAESKIYVNVDPNSKKSLFIPINGWGVGLWKIRFALESNGQILDQKFVDLEVLDWNNTINGPKELGYTIPIEEFIQAERPSITGIALTALDIVYLILQAKYGVKDPASLWILSPKPGSTSDAIEISAALHSSTWTFLDVKKTKFPNQYIIKTTYEVTPYHYFKNEYTFYSAYDRAITVVTLPSGVEVLDSGNADFIKKADDGTTIMIWVDNYCDKLLKELIFKERKTHQLLVQAGEGVFRITSHTYFQIGPFWPKPEKGSFPIIDYQAWNQDPNNVYWILMATKSVSRDITGITVKFQETKQRLLLSVHDSHGRHVGWSPNNQIEVSIPGAYYFDNLNGTVYVYLPANVTDFKVSVDARHAHELIETFELTIFSISNDLVADQTTQQASIKKGDIREYNVNISEDGVINLTPVVSRTLNHYILIFGVILVTIVGSGVYLFAKRKRQKER